MSESPSTKLLGRSAAARVLCVSDDTLLNYERRNIVRPTRDSSGKRLYSAADIESAQRYRNERALTAASKKLARSR